MENISRLDPWLHENDHRKYSEILVLTLIWRIYASNIYLHTDCITTNEYLKHRDFKCIGNHIWYIYIYIIFSPYIYIYVYICVCISLVHDVYDMYFIILLRYLSIAYILCVLILFDRYWHCIVYSRHVDIMRKFIANILESNCCRIKPSTHVVYKYVSKRKKNGKK